MLAAAFPALTRNVRVQVPLGSLFLPGCRKVGNPPAWGAGERGFNSHHPDFAAAGRSPTARGGLPVGGNPAQFMRSKSFLLRGSFCWQKRLALNQEAAGSIPAPGTAQPGHRSVGTVRKPVKRPGSNPGESVGSTPTRANCRRPVRLRVRSPLSQRGKRGSTPLRVTVISQA